MLNTLIVFALENESSNLFSEYQTLYTGVGKLNATYNLLKYIHQTRPSVVINLGTAGSAIHPTGSIVHATKFIQRDMDVSPLGFSRWETPFSNEPAILEYGIAIDHLPHGICGTGDSFDTSHTGEHYDLVDMEAYALAKVCKAENIPFACIKFISDGADGAAANDWTEALLHGPQKLKEALITFERTWKHTTA